MIVTASAEAPLSSILEQMTVYDSLILAMLYHAAGKVQNVLLVARGGGDRGADR